MNIEELLELDDTFNDLSFKEKEKATKVAIKIAEIFTENKLSFRQSRLSCALLLKYMEFDERGAFQETTGDENG